MVRSLWTAATGMNGQQANIDTIFQTLIQPGINSSVLSLKI